MFETALRTMEKSNKCYMYEYYDDIKDIHEKLKTKQIKVLSSDEIIAAIILSNYRFEYEINYKILNYEVDFYIPELKVCLEIDGDRHKHRVTVDSKRDVNIRTYLGLDWEIVRIPTIFLEQNPEKLVEAIEQVVKDRKKMRKQNHGYTTYNYNRYEDSFYST